jgi:hypothetical protein
MNLEDRLIERIGKEFTDAEQVIVVGLLRTYAGPERDRVCWDILELSGGNLDKLREYVEAARIDYRDILYWAEYFETDPMVRGGNAKQLVDEILAKWGDTTRLS